MEQYFVEGLVIPRRGRNKAGRRGKGTQASVEPFARSFWATSPEEAIQMALEALGGGQWVEGPKISQVSEAQRMQEMGAPRLPGF
jgi:hypothetical protein